jgi:hypothetical protein
MSVLARHRYIISRVAEAFSIADENEVESMMVESEALQTIDNFFSASGPTQILISIQEVVETRKVGHFGNQVVTVKKLIVYSGDVESPPRISVYFSKNRRGRDNDDHVSIDPTKINDNALSFGVIRSPVETLEVLMRCVYKPMIEAMPESTWGEASSEQKTEFMGSVDTFIKGLQESIRSLSGGLELQRTDPKRETMTANSVEDPQLVSQCMNLMQDWCVNIERYLDDSDRSRWENADSGPDTELEFWKSRSQRFLFNRISYILSIINFSVEPNKF